MLSEAYWTARRSRDELSLRAREARAAGDDGLADELWERCDDLRRACWALTARIDARTMHARGQKVLCQPKDGDDREAWLKPDLAGAVADLELVVAHYRESTDQRDGPLRSAEAGLRFLLSLRDAAPAGGEAPGR